MKDPKRIAVLGASGYTGRELLRLLAAHPGARVELAMSARSGVPEPPELPELSDFFSEVDSDFFSVFVSLFDADESLEEDADSDGVLRLSVR